GTIKTYRTSFAILQEFEINKKYKLSFDTINASFYEKYIDFLMNEKGLVNNTIGNKIKAVKSFMTFCFDRGYHNNLDFKRFKVFKEDADIIALNINELTR